MDTLPYPESTSHRAVIRSSLKDFHVLRRESIPAFRPRSIII